MRSDDVTTVNRQPVQLTDDACESLLRDLVSVPSPSHDERGAVELLVGWMARHGYDEAHIDAAGNAVGVIGTGPREIVLLGHIDTFAGNPTVRQDGRLLYGRGTVDAKGPLCTFAAAAASASLPDDVRLIVVGAVEEEAASSKGARHIAASLSPEMCVIGEPSRWDRITLGYKGRLLLDWAWRGPLAHSAGQVPLPPERAFAFWQDVRAYVDGVNADRERLFERLDAALQAVNSGQDGAYGWATATVGFRLPPAIDPHELAAELQSIDVDSSATLDAHGMEHAHVAAADSPLSRAFRGAIRAEGGRPAFVHKTGTSDMNVVGRLWDCPMIAYGPGDSALDHTPDEHIDLDEYLRAVRVLRAALARL